jgi:hypothetical protein
MLYVILKHNISRRINSRVSSGLETYGRIYMYRFRPDYEMRARPIEEYPEMRQAKAIM